MIAVNTHRFQLFLAGSNWVEKVDQLNQPKTIDFQLNALKNKNNNNNNSVGFKRTQAKSDVFCLGMQLTELLKISSKNA